VYGAGADLALHLAAGRQVVSGVDDVSELGGVDERAARAG
jgi:hypothetical protein